MTALEIIKTVYSSGAKLAVIDGTLKAKKMRLLHEETINQLKKHKAEIIRLLIKEKKSTTPAKFTLSVSDPDCRTFMVAHSWISHHRLKLKQAGWTAPELYRRNRSKGIIWLELWDDKAATPSLGDNGEIIFTIIRHDKKIVQTAWPKKNTALKK